MQYRTLQVLPQGPRRDKIDRNSDDPGHVPFQSSEIEQAEAVRKIDEQVNIRTTVVFTPDHAAENPGVPDPRPGQ